MLEGFRAALGEQSSLPKHSILKDHLAAHATVDDELLPRDETCRIGQQPGDLSRHILHRAHSADRMLSMVEYR